VTQRKNQLIIIGQRRSGTTSLYRVLDRHADIWMHPKADFNYFIDRELSTRHPFPGKLDQAAWDNYSSVEDYYGQFKSGAAYRYQGHKGADLLYMTESHQRIFRYAPDAKMIVILRNPIKRAWSQYWNEVGKGREKISFSDAIRQEKRRINQNDYERCHFSYVDRGLYMKSLQQLFKVFKREQVHIVILEKMFTNQKEELAKVFRFLQLDYSDNDCMVPRSTNKNWSYVENRFCMTFVGSLLYQCYRPLAKWLISIYTKEKEHRRLLLRSLLKYFVISVDSIKMSVEDRNYLSSYYSQSIDELSDFLGDNLDEWKLP
jgi:hypothetical protein